MILWSFFWGYILAIGREREEREGSFRPSILGLGEIIFDLSKRQEEFLIRVVAESLFRRSQPLVGSMLSIGKNNERKKKRLIAIQMG